MRAYNKRTQNKIAGFVEQKLYALPNVWGQRMPLTPLEILRETLVINMQTMNSKFKTCLEQVFQHCNAQNVAFHHGRRRPPKIAVAQLQNCSCAWGLQPRALRSVSAFTVGRRRRGRGGGVINVDDAAVAVALVLHRASAACSGELTSRCRQVPSFKQLMSCHTPHRKICTAVVRV